MLRSLVGSEMCIRDRLTNAPIFIDDSPALNIFELRAKCRRLKSQHNVEPVSYTHLTLPTIYSV
mgnify:CR=1 FL=1